MTDRVFALVLAALVAGVMIAGQVVDGYSWPVARMPVLMGGLTVLLLIWVALFPRPLPARDEDPAGDDASATGARPGLARDLTGMVQVLAAIPAFWGLGFVAGAGVYIFGILIWHRQGWLAALLGGLGGALIAWGLFAQALGVPIPLGPIPLI